ncbi:MAG TPA: prepilin-type N-terminal cleavage/methylation domain-containing protein [Sporichthya sp.]|nr:prepilin-type N-terminal cleavage/methylation domain-containing protein [Sporichthya sp.]
MYTALRKSLNRENDKGFTLIELLVVIIIIGILAAIAIPIFLNQRKKAFEAGQKSDARSIATEMETYFTDAQTYPAAGGVTQAGQVLTWTTAATGDVEDTVRLSPGNDATIKANANGFCVTVTNTPNDAVIVYNSTLGGLQPKGSTCDAAVFTVAVLA